MKLFRYNWLLLMFATCLLAVSCKEDDSSIPEIKPNDPVNTEDVKKVLNSATTEWGLSRDAVIKHMDGYKTVSGTDKDMLQFKPEKGGQSIAYRFADDKLIATAVLLPTTSAELELQSMLNGYAYFAKLSDGEVYENRTANTLATVWNPAEANSSFSAIGFAPIKYANYGMSSSITVNTGEVSDIATNSVTLSGSLTGVTTSVEVGFFYGTENTLTEQSDKKSTTSSSNFSVTLTELSSNKTYYYRAYAIVDDMYYYGEIKTFTTKDYKICPNNNHPHWIDLGIGTLWRCCNEGASTPEEYGGYYTFEQAQAYNPPSPEQIKALVNNCSYTWTTEGGKFTGPNGGTIFLPAAGSRLYGEFRNVGSYGYYWSSTPYDEKTAYDLLFNSDKAYWNHTYYRYYERSVRPVR